MPSDICKVLIDEQGIRTNLPESWPKELQAKADRDQSDVDMDNTAKLVECIFLMSQCPLIHKKLKEMKVHELLIQVSVPKTQEYIDVNCRIDDLVL